MSKIKCSVDSCNYWESNKCTADQIEVAKNFVQTRNDMEAGNIGSASVNSNETQCLTFKPAN